MGVEAASPYTFRSMLNLGIHAVPRYQRSYSWTKKQLSNLWDDIHSLTLTCINLERATGDKSKWPKHYLGAVVVVNFDPALGVGQREIEGLAETVFHVVDGQQRLATLMLLLRAMQSIAREPDTSGDKRDAERIHKSVMKLIETDADADDGRPILKVVLSEDDNPYFRSLLVSDGPIPHGNLASHRRLNAAYKFFRTALRSSADEALRQGVVSSHLAYYAKVLDVIKEKLDFTHIRVDGVESAFQVFESLNAKGLRLSAADLVKNLLLQVAYKHHGDVTRAEQRWASIGERLERVDPVVFLRHHLCSVIGQPVRKAEIYPRVRDWVNRDGCFPVLEELTRSAEYYRQITSGVSTSHGSASPAQRSLEELRMLPYQQVNILLLAAVERWSVTSGEMAELLRALVSLLVRYSVCDRNPNQLEKSFSAWARAVRDETMDLAKLLQSIALETPSDEDFKDCFAELIIGESESRWGRYLLTKIEFTLDSESAKILDLDDITLEHIIPRDVEVSEWFDTPPEPKTLQETINRIGNLALLYAPENSSASNRSYTDKTRIYRTTQGRRGGTYHVPATTFRLIAELLDQYPNRFGIEEVRARSHALAELALRTWRRPEVAT